MRWNADRKGITTQNKAEQSQDVTKTKSQSHKRLFELLRIGKRYTNNAEHCQNYFIVFFQFCTIMDYDQTQTKLQTRTEKKKNFLHFDNVVWCRSSSKMLKYVNDMHNQFVKGSTFACDNKHSSSEQFQYDHSESSVILL